MDEREYEHLADAALARIEANLEDADIDFEIVAGGILEIELADGAKVVVNKHSAVREIWVAARSGGFHYRWDGEAWRDCTAVVVTGAVTHWAEPAGPEGAQP